jgi:DegV family protein with EDD domain
MLQLITDSSSDLPPEFLEKYHIHVVPLTVTIDGEEYTEGVDITPEEFCRKMLAAHSLPKTSQPSSQKFANLFQELSSKGQMLCMTVSSKLSGTYQSACIGQKLAGVNVAIFDTLAGTLGHGLQLIKAGEMNAAGLPLEEIIDNLKAYREKMNILIFLDTLENLVKGGRLSKVQGAVTKLLNIKVILEGVEGSIELLDKLRGRNKAISCFLARIEERCRGLKDMQDRIFGIAHMDNLGDAEFFKQYIVEKYHPKEVIVAPAGATIGTYAGKGGIIISF